MGYHLNLNAGAFRQRGDLDGGPRREVRREVLGIHLVHPGEVRQVRHEYCALDDIGERQVLVIEDRLDVLQNAVGLRLDIAGDKVPGSWVEGNLTGAEKQVAYAHGVIVRPDGGRGLGWFNDVLLRHCGVILLLRPNGSSRAGGPNPKPETRNPEQIQTPKAKGSKQRHSCGFGNSFPFLPFRFVSGFGFRASDFIFISTSLTPYMLTRIARPFALYPSPRNLHSCCRRSVVRLVASHEARNRRHGQRSFNPGFQPSAWLVRDAHPRCARWRGALHSAPNPWARQPDCGLAGSRLQAGAGSGAQGPAGATLPRCKQGRAVEDRDPSQPAACPPADCPHVRFHPRRTPGGDSDGVRRWLVTGDAAR